MPGNAEVVQRLNRAFQGKDEAGMLSCLDPEVELRPIRAQLEGGSYQGHQGFLRMVADVTADWDELGITYTEVRESGDRVGVASRLTARGRSSGIDLDVPLGFLFEFRDGVAVRISSYADPADALEAAEG